MKNDVRLFIENQEVEFSIDPKILFNYKITDITNPSVIKNSFSKTIEIDGTPENNKIFQNIWNLERVQWVGINFNPMKKANFVLYVNSEIYEKGYAKLDSVSVKNNKCSYSITLFGGLGSFFYSLSYNDGEGQNKKTLADLNFGKREQVGSLAPVFYQEPDLNFVINKDAVFDAINQEMGASNAAYSESEVVRPDTYLWNDRWEVLNFVPAYNGVPDNFDADKCLINSNNMPIFTFSKTDGGTNYYTYNGYAMGEQPNDDLTEWETLDLRSYLQRPVVNFRRIIDACCNPQNNGGFEVVLDDTFFNYDNPYYNDAWMTLPMLRESVKGGEQSTSTTAILVPKDSSSQPQKYEISYDSSTLSNIINVDMGITVSVTCPSATNDEIYMYKKLTASYGEQAKTDRVDYTEQISSMSFQLAAYDALGKCVAASDIYFITDVKAKGKTDFNTNVPWNTDVPKGNIKNIYGKLVKNSSTGLFDLVDENGDNIVLGFSFGNSVPYLKLELLYCPVTYEYSRWLRSYKWWKGAKYNGYQYFSQHVPFKTFSLSGVTYGGNITYSSAFSLYSLSASTSFALKDFRLVQEDYENIFSNTPIRKDQILNTDNTPAEYLISYAKMFGLHFYREPSEQASDPNVAPNGVIHIMTRDTFYNDEIVNLEEWIDRSKGIKINPTTSNSKWFNFNIEQADSEANKEYKDKFNNDYGYQKINTGYNFNAENKALLDKVVFKGGVEVLEMSKYYQQPIDGYPAYAWNGFKYTLFNTGGNDLKTLEIDNESGPIPRISINPNGWADTDGFKKPQFHGKNNDPADGRNVLLFHAYNNYVTDYSWNYWITDDLTEMVALNDSTPCWIMTAEMADVSGNKIAYPMQGLPIYERNLVYDPTATYIHSWDMGQPQMTFVRDIYGSEQATIYYKNWKNYISDLYSQDNRILTAYVVFKERPNSELLRKFYWFDNSIWIINSIKDWNIASYEPTQVEFVKVIDRANYRLKQITSNATVSFGFSNLTDITDPDVERTTTYTTDYRAKECTMVIDTGNAGGWFFSDDMIVDYEDGTSEYFDWYADNNAEKYLIPSTLSGRGSTIKIFNLPENTTNQERKWNFSISDDSDRYYWSTIIQGGKPDPEITFTPASVTGPASGGQVQVQVYYAGRGNDNVFTDDNESYEYMTYSLGAWNGDYATLTITFQTNTTNTVLSGDYIKVEGVNSYISNSIAVNQAAN